MGLVERERECEKCTVMSGEGTSKEFPSRVPLLLLWVCFAVLQQELKGSLLFACSGMNQLEQLVLPKFFSKIQIEIRFL